MKYFFPSIFTRLFFVAGSIPCSNIYPPIFLAGSVLFGSSLTPRIPARRLCGGREPLSPLDSDFNRFHNYLSPYGFIYQPTLLEMIKKS